MSTDAKNGNSILRTIGEGVGFSFEPIPDPHTRDGLIEKIVNHKRRVAIQEAAYAQTGDPAGARRAVKVWLILKHNWETRPNYAQFLCLEEGLDLPEFDELPEENRSIDLISDCEVAA